MRNNIAYMCITNNNIDEVLIPCRNILNLEETDSVHSMYGSTNLTSDICSIKTSPIMFVTRE